MSSFDYPTHSPQLVFNAMMGGSHLAHRRANKTENNIFAVTDVTGAFSPMERDLAFVCRDNPYADEQRNENRFSVLPGQMGVDPDDFVRNYILVGTFANSTKNPRITSDHWGNPAGIVIHGVVDIMQSRGGQWGDIGAGEDVIWFPLYPTEAQDYVTAVKTGKIVPGLLSVNAIIDFMEKHERDGTIAEGDEVGEALIRYFVPEDAAKAPREQPAPLPSEMVSEPPRTVRRAGGGGDDDERREMSEDTWKIKLLISSASFGRTLARVRPYHATPILLNPLGMC